MIAKIFVLVFSIIIVIVAIVMVKQYTKDKIHKTNIEKAHEYLHKLTYEELSLEGLYCIFKEITQHLDISFILNPYGMFRANSLEECRTTDIFLGDINGLWTLTLNRWMQTDDIEAIKEVTYQFKNELINILNKYINYEKSK